MAIFVAALAAAGFVIATSFAAAYYRPGSPLSRLVPPEWCRIHAGGSEASQGSAAELRAGGDGCASVVYTPAGRLLGVPNAVLGLAYYAATGWLASLGFPQGLRPWHVLAAWFVVAVGAYLGYRLLRVERMSCPLCWTAHALNTVLAIALTVVARNLP